jgi:CDP-glucose 4,6-dehydratase
MNYAHLSEYYKGKRVFLTGHTGFKGSWMLQWLVQLGAVVKGYALAPESNDDHYNVIGGDSLCQSVIADLRDSQRLENELLEFQPDYVFHLAAQPLVRLSYQIPSDTFLVNAIGTAYLLDAVKKLDKPCAVVLITTDKVYENKEWNYPYREVDRLGGHDPYSASKACAEIVIQSYRQSFFSVETYAHHKKAIASARAGNVIGGGDWAKDRIVPDMVRSLNQNTPVELRSPNAVRPWQHVLEPVAGYLHLGTKLIDAPEQFSKAFNFGPHLEDNLTVEALVKKAIKILGKGAYIVRQPDVPLHEAKLLKLDISLAINELGWVPKYSAALAIEKTMEWYQVASSGRRAKTIEQITEYALA